MALPGITLPDGVPILLGEGHAIEESSVFAAVKPTTGHRRMRRLYTVPDRVVPVNWSLNSAQMAVFDDWFENALAVGSNFFSIRVKDQDSAGLLWWKAKWVEPYTADPVAPNRWHVTGSVKLFGEGSATPPDVSALALEISVPLTGSAVVTAPQGLELEITVALVSTTGIGNLEFSAQLLQVSFAVSAAPAVGAMTIAMQAPTAVLTNNTFTYPTTGSISLTGAAPIVNDPFIDDVSLLLHANGTNGSSSFIDSSLNGWTVTAVGGAVISTAQSRFGGSAASLNGSTAYLTVPHNAAFSIQAGTSTLEAWVYRAGSGVEDYLLSKRSDTIPSAANEGWEWRINATDLVQFFYTGGSSLTSSATVPSGQWVHLAVVRNGSTVTHYINGVAAGAGTFSNGIENTTDTLKVGVANDASTFFNGYLDDIRITKGIARYTSSSFAVPTVEHSHTPLDPRLAHVLLHDAPSALWLLNETSGTTIVDSSGASVNGTYTAANVTLNQAALANGSASILAGTSDTAPVGLVANQAAVQFGAGDFTIVACIKVSAWAAVTRRIISKEQAGAAFPEYALSITSSGNLTFYVNTSNSSGTAVSATSSSTFDDNVAHLVVVERSGSTIKAFVDNVEVISFTFSGTIYSSGQDVGIGCANALSSSFSSSPFGGYLSHVAVIKKAVGATRRSAYYDAFLLT